MHHTLNYIMGQPEDFTIYVNRKAVNWYENESHHACGSNKFENDERDVEKLSEEIWGIRKEACDDPGNIGIGT